MWPQFRSSSTWERTLAPPRCTESESARQADARGLVCTLEGDSTAPRGRIASLTLQFEPEAKGLLLSHYRSSHQDTDLWRKRSVGAWVSNAGHGIRIKVQRKVEWDGSPRAP